MGRSGLRRSMAATVVVGIATLGVDAAAAAPAAATVPATAAVASDPVLGSFVIGDGNAVPAEQVLFWGAQWAKDNVVSGGKAPDSFKGWADTVVPTPGAECAGTFTTAPGNSSNPPPSAAVAPGSEIEVLVTNDVTKDGPVISGTYVNIARVQVNPDSDYEPDPGHPGIGTVVTLMCPGGAGFT